MQEMKYFSAFFWRFYWVQKIKKNISFLPFKGKKTEAQLRPNFCFRDGLFIKVSLYINNKRTNSIPLFFSFFCSNKNLHFIWKYFCRKCSSNSVYHHVQNKHSPILTDILKKMRKLCLATLHKVFIKFFPFYLRFPWQSFPRLHFNSQLQNFPSDRNFHLFRNSSALSITLIEVLNIIAIQ